MNSLDSQLSAAEWRGIFDVLSHFPAKDPLDDNAKAAYKFILRKQPLAAIVGALDILIAGGAKGQTTWRPAAPDILAAIRHDPSAPTFDEALVLLFRRHGVLDVRVRGTTDTNPNYRAELYEKVGGRLAELHPLIGGFVQRVGLERLRSMNIDGEDGHWRRKELRETWTDFVESSQHREVAALAAGTGQRGLARLDPLAALGIGSAPAELEVGGSS